MRHGAQLLLEGVGRPEDRRLVECLAHELQAHRSPSSGATPHGIEIAVAPASEVGTVQTSDRYMVRGSCIFSPIPNAVVGDVGERRTS